MKIIVGALLLLSSSMVMANEQISARKITALQLYETYAVAELESPGQNSAECTKSSAENYVGFFVNTDEGERMLTMLLSARIAGKAIGFGVAGCLTWGNGTVPKVYRLDL